LENEKRISNATMKDYQKQIQRETARRIETIQNEAKATLAKQTAAIKAKSAKEMQEKEKVSN
jgi:hypothetical protein